MNTQTLASRYFRINAPAPCRRLATLAYWLFGFGLRRVALGLRPFLDDSAEVSRAWALILPPLCGAARTRLLARRPSVARPLSSTSVTCHPLMTKLGYTVNQHIGGFSESLHFQLISRFDEGNR